MIPAFQPDYAVPPARTLRETLVAVRIPQIEAAQRLDLTASRFGPCWRDGLY